MMLILQAEYLIYKERYSSSDAPANQKIPDFQVRGGETVLTAVVNVFLSVSSRGYP